MEGGHRVNMTNVPDVDAIGWEGLGAMLDGVHRAMATLDTVMTTPLIHKSTSITGVDRHRVVAVTMAGGRPSSVSIDPARAARSGRQGLSDALNQEFEDAYARYDRDHDAASPDDDGELANAMREMQSIVARITGIDPDTESRMEA
jgi:DNA-binding protein YbaB